MATQNAQGVTDPGSGPERAPHVTRTLSQRGKEKSVYCKFFGTKNAGDACPFIHDASKLQNNGPRPKAGRKPVPEQDTSGPSQNTSTNTENEPAASSTEGRRFIPPPVDGSRVVGKPVPKAQAEDPREFQIKQLKRRFSPTETAEDGGTAFTFQMVPSDPDFPFEMVGLECVLHVPVSYPKEGKPSLDVKNEEMGREWQVRVERGFARLAERAPQGTLLGLMNSLDRQLEGLLVDRKEDEGITIILNQLPRQAEPVNSLRPAKSTTPNPPIASKPQEVYTSEQRHQASQRRETETRQLEARLGRTPLFSKSSDGIAYTIPITPRKHADLPVPLQVVKAIKLFVPMLYPLQHYRIELQNVSREAAKATEKGFEKKMKEVAEGNLMGHVNWLAQNMHVLATEVINEPVVEAEVNKAHDLPPVQAGESAIEKVNPAMKGEHDDRSHIKLIPPPPEWIMVNEGEADYSSESDYSDSYDSGDEDEYGEKGGAALETVPESSAPTGGPERGISLSFPSLELYGIELLELVSLCITIKCERCKDTMDINNLRDTANKSESCKKCAMALSVGYRRELMHINSNYRPEDCGICHSSLIKKAGSGFWEGGKGTRDKSKMSRKDPRKYKRRAGGTARKVKA
ncbi:hypothetical protein OEA41_002396 [Lepraria neglecta]|uniref:C3H1-type domain-containing protein n=1 Tax=Lepraria neglecta TaxID=209136 RepID=A0AAD9ZBI7_9LECA|nr:hypothetical protein OEA41_002396 [Lepraria neglecta]